jgi:hypothetical protein
MTEMDDRWQAPTAEVVEPQHAAAVEERSQSSRAMAGAAVVLLLLLPVAFATGWRLGRIVGALRGY